MNIFSITANGLLTITWSLFLAVLRQLCGEWQSVLAWQDTGRPDGHSEHTKPGQCALCGQWRPAAERRGYATSGALQPRTGVQSQQHAAGPGAALHRRPHHGGQRYMTLVARPAAPLLIELTPGPGQTLQSVDSGANLVHESMLKTSAGCQYGPLSMKCWHHWRH